MRFADRDRFSGASVGWFHRLVGAAMLSTVSSEVAARVALVHAGKLFPYRHLPGVPLYGVHALYVEWAATALAGLALMLGARLRVTLRFALLMALIGISQRYSNHRALLVIVLAFASLDAAAPDEDGFDARPRPALALLRYQLAIVYVTSALAKLAAGFLSGDVLTGVLRFPVAWARPLAFATVALELALPIVLVRWPRPGVALVAALHVAFALALPSTWPFAFLMLALAVLFVVETGRSPEPDLH